MAPADRGTPTWILTTLGWGCYLACSWTWCIGMFLPVLLVRDYGIWGFVVFAAPNVVGAAAMGWVLRRPGASGAILAGNTAVCRAFSLVTVAFHLWFLVSMVTGFGVRPLKSVSTGSLPGPAGWLLLPVCLVLPVFAIASRRAGLMIAAIVWAASLLILTGVVPYVWDGFGAWVARLPPPGPELGWMAPACLFGFLLCPYLDATFHAARREQREPGGSASFILGFGVLFLFMILGTLAYTPLLLPRTDDPAVNPGWVGAALVLHVFMQALFTVVIHLAAACRPDRPWLAPGERRFPRFPRHAEVAATIGVLCILGLALLPLAMPIFRGRPTPEVVYRLFMSFYGLVFPAYVWVCMIPTRDGHTGVGGATGRRRMFVWITAVAVSAPAFWMGFIERQEWLLAPGLAVVLLSRLCVPGGFGRAPREPYGAPVPAPSHPPKLAAHARPAPDPGAA